MNNNTGADCGYLVSAPWRSSGKTLVSVGLAHEASRQQLALQSFKKGPDFIDPLWLAYASGKPCFNLDPWVQQTDELIACYRKRMAPGTFGLVEGTMGLHDGLHSDGSDSNASIAKLLGLKVLLVVDCRGMHRTIAALVNGLQQFDPSVQFAGVILNRIRSSRHGGKITAAINEHTNMPVLGEMPESDAVHIAEKQLGLIPAPEFNNQAACIETIANLVRDHCDLPKLFHGVSAAKPVTAADANVHPAFRIGIAKDEAFHFYYQDDLEVFRNRRVELVEVSPLRDAFPDNLDGMIIGGGFPERYAAALTDNRQFRAGLKSAIEAGLPVHAECGGLMYLCRALAIDSTRYNMVGTFDATVSMREKPVGRGYVKLRRLTDDKVIAAHEFHHSTVQIDDQPFAYAVERGYGIDGRHDGICCFNAHASYAHFRHTRQLPWVDEFLSRIENAGSPAAAASR
jgi:cobyrinic acid a,c-diamide synthase